MSGETSAIYPPESGVWVTLNTTSETVDRVWQTELDALRGANGEDYLVAVFIPFGTTIAEAVTVWHSERYEARS